MRCSLLIIMGIKKHFFFPGEPQSIISVSYIQKGGPAAQAGLCTGEFPFSILAVLQCVICWAHVMSFTLHLVQKQSCQNVCFSWYWMLGILLIWLGYQLIQHVVKVWVVHRFTKGKCSFKKLTVCLIHVRNGRYFNFCFINMWKWE